MKKFFTLFAVAALAVSAYAQTPLTIGGGWNDGFVGEADVYEYQITSQWGAAEFYMDINPADYPTATLTFDGPCPTGFQANYTWGDAATPEYGVVAIEGETSATITFNPEHKNIKMVAVQHTTEDAATLKIKKVVLNAADGTTLEVASAFTGWAGKDVSKTYKGTVKLNSQYMQLVISGATGMEGINVKIESPEPLPAGIQFCVDYEDGTSEWPQIAAGETTATVSTAEGKKIKNLGIQRQEAGAMTLTISGAYLMENSPETPEISFLDVQEGDITANSITVRWTPGADVNGIQLTGSSWIGLQICSLSQEEIEKGVIMLGGETHLLFIDPETEYTVALCKGTDVIVEKVYKTAAAAPATEVSFLDVQEGDITANSITVRWTPNDEITSINIDLGFMKQMTKLMEDEVKAGVYTINAMLMPETEYTIWLSKIVEGGEEVKFAEKVYKTAAEAPAPSAGIVLFEGSEALGWGGAKCTVPSETIEEGATLKVTYETTTGEWWQYKVVSNTDGWPSIELGGEEFVNANNCQPAYGWAACTRTDEFVLDAKQAAAIAAGLVVQGSINDGSINLLKVEVIPAGATGIINVNAAASSEESFNLYGQKSNGNGFSVKGGKIYLKK